MFVNRLPAVANVGDCADDEECGEAIESEDFAGDEDGGPERVACACEHGGKAECCGEGDGHPEHACDEDSEGSADGEKRGDDTADKSGGEREDCECEFQNPVIPGDVPNQVGTPSGTPRSIPGNSKTHVQQVCSESCVASLEKHEQKYTYSHSHNCNSLNAVREFFCEEILRESKQLCKSATDNAKEHAHQREFQKHRAVKRAFVRENACRESACIKKRIQINAELVESEHA